MKKHPNSPHQPTNPIQQPQFLPQRKPIQRRPIQSPRCYPICPPTTSSQLAQSHVSSGIEDTISALTEGRVKLQEPPTEQNNPQHQTPKPSKQELQKELERLNEIIRMEKAAQLKSKTERQQQEKDSKAREEEERKREVEKKLQKWKEERKIQEIRKNLMQKREMEKMEEEKRKEQLSREKIQFQVAEAKKRQYMDFMKEIQTRKQERLRSLSNKIPKRAYSEAKLPLLNIQIKSQSKPKQQVKLDFDEIKMHEKLFMQKIKERSPKSIEQLAAKHDDQWSLTHHRTQKEIQDEKVKMKRRLLFDQKRKEIPVEVNQQKENQRLILIDKQKNPIKYLVLGRKGLSDEAIYKMSFDPIAQNRKGRQYGNSYLQQLRNKTAEKAKTHRSNSSLKSESITVQTAKPPPKYINYLSYASQPRLTQEELLAKQAKSNPNYLLYESDQYEKEALNQIKSFTKNHDKAYKECLQTQNKIDDLFLKALKARIACMSVVKQ